MPALQRTFALAEIHRVPVLVCKYLYLDVPGIEDGFLDVDFAVAKRAFRFTACTVERGFEILRRVHQSHTLSAAACRGLEHYGIADAGCDLLGLLE